MKLYTIHLLTVLTALSNIVAASLYDSSFTKSHLKLLKNETFSLFEHAWNSYMTYGYPHDEVTPQSCKPYGPDYSNRENVVRNDALGNFSLMVLDNLDSYIIMDEYDKFKSTIDLVKNISFEQDSIVQVFETSIRVLGSLLSAHLFAIDEKKGFQIEAYDGFLLDMAYDMGERLLPAFQTKTGIPVPRVNLALGVLDVPHNLQVETCTAGAASPFLEMTLLSKLTGDLRFESFTRNTYLTIWNSRSELDLVPMTLDPVTGSWKDSVTGIGASIDSFYEYALKSAILFDDKEMLTIWTASYKALSIHSKSTWYFANVETVTGYTASTWIDALGAFWPGLQVLSGNLDDALHTHALYLKIWDSFESIPERWNFLNVNNLAAVELEWYPLRPEFIESTYHLYRATKDPMFLQIGQRVLKDLKEFYWEPCGFSGYSDIRIGTKQDRMESFVLSETLKYLYLLFDVDNSLHNIDDNIIFSTEGHLLWYNDRLNPLHNTALRNYAAEKNKTTSSIVSKKENENESFLKKFTTDPKSTFRSLWNSMNVREITNIDENLSENRAQFERDQEIAEEYLKNRIEMSGLEQNFLAPSTDIYNLEYCAVNPLQNTFHSAYLNWQEFFLLDKRYEKTLTKPKHLQETNRNPAYIELESKFYNRFSEGKQKCSRYPTTDGYELLMGDKNYIRFTQIDKLVVDPNKTEQFRQKSMMNDLVVWPNDYWVPNFSNLRINIERLKRSQVDTYNDIITDELIQDIRRDDYNLDGVCNLTQSNNEIDSVLRIKTLNGVTVNKGEVIWTLPFDVISDEVGITTEGRIKFHGKPIENLRVWYG